MIFLHFSVQKFLESSFLSCCDPKLLCQVWSLISLNKEIKKQFVYNSLLLSKIKKKSYCNKNFVIAPLSLE